VFMDSTTKVDSEPPNGSNDDITNPYECKQTLYVSAAVQASVFFVRMMFEHSSSSLGLLCQKMFGQNSSGLVLHLEDVWTKQFRPRSSS
ncbi:hypothetical protein Tco_0392229, partial [Tanacetum coccineum]